MTTKRIAADAIRASGNAGPPSRNAGSRKTASTRKATRMPTKARNPRQRATRQMTIAKAAATAISGQVRS
ncbi:Uncharacterised protein [Mycobacteroides abscessus subsp. abscessus]|nr:Uncharacterised protein [Mycobacteroides abscessus subsp. abscessus]